jgi:carbon-monoxide dehydrogenase medium subunit
MIPAEFEYRAPESLQEAASLMAKYKEDAKLLAGGHSLIPLMKLRLARPHIVVDLSGIPGLSYIDASAGTVSIGTMTTHYEIESSDVLAEKLTALQEAAASIGDVQVRNRGTIGGSLAHADPAADYPAPILAFGAELVARGPRSDREWPAARFFVDQLTTALRPQDILREIRIPIPAAGTGSAYVKLTQKASGFAIVGVAAVVTLKGGIVDSARIAVTGVAEKAFVARWVSRSLVGREPDDTVIRRAARRVMRGVDFVNDDVHASADYRRAMAVVFTQRALQRAVSRAAS